MTEIGLLDITPSPRLLQVLGAIPLEPWQCLAELVDNSLDELLKDTCRTMENPLTVAINVVERGTETFLRVEDNGQGMELPEFERSLRAGYTSKGRYGTLGLFGMGFNIATARLGNVTTVRTKTVSSASWLAATISFEDLQARESYQIPYEVEPGAVGDCGTVVEVRLKKEVAGLFRDEKHLRAMAATLGDVYSFLLRDAVPGLRDDMSSRMSAVISVNGEPIQAKLPCVWRDDRTVVSQGREVNAIQYVDQELTVATACLDCGYWDRKNGPEVCEECGSRHLESKKRRIWGWLGIQRYIDSNHYGIDFIRYGRKILIRDKRIFSFADPDDVLRIDVEYPIEMPANNGRIVGEIHLDHVPVTYQKNDFEQQSYDWQKALSVIRGDGPLKPKRSERPNTSPLALLYSAFRRNDAGRRYLTPGDGKGSIHSKTRQWASYFEKGVERFRDDTEWYEAVLRHEQIKAGSLGAEGEPGSSPEGDLLPPAPPPSPPGVRPGPAPSAGSGIDAVRQMSTHRRDLSGTFRLGNSLGSWDIEIFVTRDDLEGGAPAVPGKIQGTSLEVFVSGAHPIFTEYGRDVRDVALLQAAALIRDLKNAEVPLATVFGQLLTNLPDLRVTVPVLLERVERTLDRVRAATEEVIRGSALDYWAVLDGEEKRRVEALSAVRAPSRPFETIVSSGEFAAFLTASGLANLMRHAPSAFFEGAVFTPSIAGRTEEAQARMIDKVAAALVSLQDFRDDDLLRERHDLQLAQVNLDALDELTSDLISDA